MHRPHLVPPAKLNCLFSSTHTPWCWHPISQILPPLPRTRLCDVTCLRHRRTSAPSHATVSEDRNRLRKTKGPLPLLMAASKLQPPSPLAAMVASAPSTPWLASPPLALDATTKSWHVSCLPVAASPCRCVCLRPQYLPRNTAARESERERERLCEGDERNSQQHSMCIRHIDAGPGLLPGAYKPLLAQIR